MKTSHTAPLEVLAAKANGSFQTEPYEAGWADEAMAMIYVRELNGPAPTLVVQAQISVDGVRWFDHPASPLRIDGLGGFGLPLTQFGNWLRLTGTVSGGEADGSTAYVLDIYWVLKG
jgi:hypothetical protein